MKKNTYTFTLRIGMLINTLFVLRSFMRKLVLICISNVIAIVAIAQVSNLDFENWYTDSLGKNRLNNWENFVRGGTVPNTALAGTWMSSDAEHGAYALKLSRWYSYTWDWVRQKAPDTIRYAGVKGYFKYIDTKLGGSTPGDYDTAMVQVFLTKWNSVLTRQDTVGSGEADLTESNSYIPFSLSVTYFSTQTPDSMTMNIVPTCTHFHGGGGACSDSSFCSFLSIDNLSLVAPDEIMSVLIQPFRFYPNPADNTLFIKTGENKLLTKTVRVIMTDCLGRVVLNESIDRSINQISLASIMPGNYFIVFKDNNGIIQTGKITKR
jgi:hypothetical protein